MIMIYGEQVSSVEDARSHAETQTALRGIRFVAKMIYTILTILIHNYHWQNNDHHPRQLGDRVAREPSRDHHFVVTALRGDDIQVNNDVNNDLHRSCVKRLFCSLLGTSEKMRGCVVSAA